MPDDFFADIPDASPRPVRVGRRPRTKNAGVRLEGVDPDLVDFAAAEDAVVTSGRDAPGVHKPHSLHGSGSALDLRTRDRTPAQVRQMQERAGGRGLHATFERGGVGGATGDHLHVVKGQQRPPARPQSAPPENFFDDVPDAPPDDFFADIPGVPQDVSRPTPQVTSEAQVPPQVPAPVPPPSIAAGRPELPPFSVPPPGARESAQQAPTLPPVSPQPSTTPQPATEGEPTTKPGGATLAAPPVNFAALGRPGYADALHDLIAAHGLKDPGHLAAYTKWLAEAGQHGDISDPTFRAQVVAGRVQGSGVTKQMPRPGAPAPVQAPQAPAAPDRPVIENGAIRVAAPPDATAESLIYRGFYDLAKSARLSDALADRYARQIASEGMQGGEEFAARARAAGGAAVGVRPENLQLLQTYLGGEQSGANIEAQMTAETGVMQASTDEQRRRAEEVRKEVEAEVGPSPGVPAGTPSPDPSRAEADKQWRAEEVETRTNQRLAMERVHGELSALIVDREKLKGEMRTAIEGRMEDYAAGKGGKFGQEYGAGMLGADELSRMLPGTRMSTLDRMAEEETDDLIKDIEFAKRSTDPNAAIGVVESVYQRFHKNPFVLLPVMSTLTDLDNTSKASDAQGRIERAQAEGRAPEQRDELTVRAHQAAEHINQTAYADIANLIVEQPAFWGEFAMMGPATGAIEGAVGRGLARFGIRGLEEGAEIGAQAFRSRLGARVLGEEALSGTSRSLAERSAYKIGEIISKTVQTTVAGGAMTGTVGIPRIGQEYVERRMKGEDGPTAFVHSVLNQAGEYVSEFQGDVLELMPGMKRLNDLLRPVMKNFEKFGYHGIAGEIYEEAWKDFIWDPATALSSAERKQRFAEAVERWSNPRTWGVMAVGFGLPGVGGAMYGHASTALSSMRQEFAGKLDETANRIAELKAQPPSEETAEAVAQAEEEQQHYTGLVEQIDAHEQEVAKTDAEIAATERAPAASETVPAVAAQSAPVEAPAAGAAEAVSPSLDVQPAATREQPVATPAESHEREEVTGVTQTEGAPVPSAAKPTAAEDFADEILRDMGGEAAAAGHVDENGFRQFPAERGSLGVPRAQMPQVKSEHRGALVNYLEARGVEHEEMMVRPSSLRPTQAEYSPAKVQKAREYEGGNRAILVSGDGYVLDGQHQLEQAYEDAPEEPVRVIALHGDAKDLLPLIHDFPSSTVNRESEGGPKEAPTDAESFADEILNEMEGEAADGEAPTFAVGARVRDKRSGEAGAVLRTWTAIPNDEAGVVHYVTKLDNGQQLAIPGDLLEDEGPARTHPAAQSYVGRTFEETGTGRRITIAAVEKATGGLLYRQEGDSGTGMSGVISPERIPAHFKEVEAAPSSSGGRGLGGAQPDNGKTIVQPPAAGESPNMSTPVTQGTGVATTDEQRAEIRGRREGIKTKLAEARRKRLAAAGAVEPGSELRHSGPALPSREEVVLTAELLLTYAQEGTLLFKDAARRFRDDVGAEYARELSKAFEAGWRLLKKKGHAVDEAGTMADHMEEENGSDESDDRGAGDEGDRGEEPEAPAGEGGEEAEAEEDLYVAPDPLEAQDTDPPRVALGRKFARAFMEGRQFPSITHARKFASEGRPKIEPGTQEAKDVDEAIEIGVGIAARETVRELREQGVNDATIYRHLVHLYTQQQPNLGVRTSTSAIEQAYSTPAPLAFIASRLAGINRRTSVLGNTAGNGMLLIEAAPETLILNEKNSARFAALEALFPLADVRQGDALALKLDHPVERYIENPPFGTVKAKTIGGGETNVTQEFQPLLGWTTSQIDHAIAFAGLSNLADNGRAVIIVGSVQNEVDQKKRADQYDAKDKRLFYYHLYRNYNVVEHFTVSGDLYERQGAGWPVDVIVIDGRGKSSRRLPAADPPRVYRSWDDLAEVLKNEHVEPEVSGVDAGDRPTGAGGAVGGRGADTRGAGAAGHGDVSGIPSRPGAGDDREGTQPTAGTDRGGVDAGEGGAIDGVTATGTVDSGPRTDNGEPGAADATRGDERPGQAAEENLRGQPGGKEDRRGDDARDVDESRPQPPEREKVDVTQTQVPYAPASRKRGLGTLIPTNLVTATQNGLDRLVKVLRGVRGDDTLDAYVRDRLGYEADDPFFNDLRAEQVDGIALAIHNIERGSAMILGDQTGLGKGRQVGGILRYARRQGRTAIFVTERPNLYKDMARDLVDIGEGSLEELSGRILMTNANETVPLNDDEESPIHLRTPEAREHNERLRAIAESGVLPDGIDYIFTTYSQMQKLGGETERQRFLAAISHGAIIVFDESHNAGGTENAGWGKKKGETAGGHDPLSRAGFARTILENAHGTLYSSATFAKRPSVMDLYAKTDMRLSVSNVPLAEMIAKGGVPLQQIVSSMLAESGQYLRRERSFEGIEYATAVAVVDHESAETVSSVMNAVFQFDKVKKESLSGIKDAIRENAEAIGVDPATGAISANSTSFSSLIHNLVDQMLLSLKMEAAIDTALESLRAGEKPVITVAFTMGSFLQQYAEDFGLQAGEAVGLNFGDMLKRYLDRTRDVTYRRPDGTKYRDRLTDEQLGPQGVELYNHAVEMIQGADWSKMPVSPIDYIKYRLEAETDKATGRRYTVGEITGRSYALDYAEHFRTKGEAPPAFRRRSQKEKSIKGRIRQIVGFNEGSIDVMILNQAGSTGLSLHASERVSDRRPRHMIVAQPERNIDTHMQLLGRIHRTGQVVPPRYTQLVADIPSEKRPAAVLAKKMASLNANTTAARGSKFKSESVVDFMNVYGDQVALQLMENNPDLHERLGEPLATAEGMDGEDAARKVTGRLPILTIAEAAAIYDELEQEYNDLIERLNALGENALEAQTLELDAKTVNTIPVFEGTGTRPFERGAFAEDVDVKRLRKPYSTAQVLDLVKKALEKRVSEWGGSWENEPRIDAAKTLGDDHLDAALRDLAALGEKVSRRQRADLQEEFDAFLAKELEAVVAVPHKDEAQEEADSRAEQRRRIAETRHREVIRRWHQAHGRYHIGQTVMVTSAETGDLYGVITDIARTGRTANPAALGAWKLTIALADAARSVNIPFSKLRMVGGADEDARTMDDTAGGSRYTVQQEDEASIFDRVELKRVTLPVLEAFERSQSVTRERRVIITGNVFAGFGRFEKSRGQIINFTDDSGNLRQGILMPQDFDIEKALDDEPIIFKDASQVFQFLTTTPGLVTTPDGHFKIARQGNDFKFTAPKAKGIGQQYWGNRAVLDAAGADFVTKGDYMTLVVRQDVGRKVVAAALLQGWTLQTNTHKERAREITGTKTKGGASAEGGYASPRGGRGSSQLDTATFRDWFGGSKVVDEEGKPLIVYHGTSHEFAAFNPDQDGAIYFSDNAAQAEEFAGHSFGTSDNRVIETYLSLRNPLIVKYGGGAFNSKEMLSLIEKAKQQGRDGLIVRDVVNFPDDGVWSTTYVAFKPTQAKSVTGNRGTFEADNPNFLESSRAGGRPSLTAQREPEADVENFQVSQRVRAILDRLNLPNAEKSIPRRLLGIFKLRERKVRVQSLFDVFTAAHEGMHGISIAEEIGERVIADTKRGATLRDRLTDIYEEFYPRARRTHALRMRIEEGLAVLAERYLLDPADIRARYGDLVSTFISPGGKYHSARTVQLLDEMAALVGDYARMSAAQRIGARVASGKEVVQRDAGYSVVERLKKNLLNKMEPLRRYAKQEGVTYTSEDPMGSYFGLLSRPALTHGWIEGRQMAVLRADGTYELRDGSVKTYLKQIKGREKEFDIFLVARRVVADHNRRAELLAEAADPLTDPERAAEAVAEAEEIKQILENDDFSLQDAVQVVTDSASDFKEAVKAYDAVNKALADFAKNAGLITPEYAHELKTSQGYAAFVRKIYDENQSDYAATHGSMNPQTKVRTFKTRKGSTLDIVSPVYTQITSVGEILGKGLQNRLWNQVLHLADSNPEIARRFEVIPTERGYENGRVTYPQIKDSKLIHILVDGEHTFVKPAQEFADVAAHLRPQELDLFAKWIKAPSSFFTRLTTSANPLWAIGNLTIDQITAAMNTQTGFKPLYDPAVSLIHYVEWLTKNAVGWATEKATGARRELNLPHADTVERYMELGGKKQTFASQYELAPEDAVARVLGGRTLYQHVAHIFETGLSLLEFPSNLSEYLTRYSEFRRSLERGDTDEVAMYKAAEVTVAFQQRGAWAGKMGENWISTLPYFNALVQVNYKFLRNAREQPGRTAAVVAALLVSGLGSALALLRYLDDDDEAKRLFMNLPARELARAIYLPNPLKKGSLIRIRVPEQVGALTGLIYLYAIQHYGGNKVKRDELFQVLTSPLPEQADITDARKMLIAWLPQAVRPSVNAYANRKTYPEVGPIVPKRLEDLKAAELQYNDYTSALGKQVGALLGVSPMKVDYWVRNQFGAVGGAVIGQMPSFPLVRTAREYEVAERAYDNFFAQKEEAEAQMERLKAAAKEKRAGAYSEAERKEIIAAATLYEKMGDVLANVRKAQGVRALPSELKREVYETLLFFDTSADITHKAEAIGRLNRAVIKHAADSGAKIDRSKAVATPEGMERVTKEGVIDLNIKRRADIKLPLPGGATPNPLTANPRPGAPPVTRAQERAADRYEEDAQVWSDEERERGRPEISEGRAREAADILDRSLPEEKFAEFMQRLDEADHLGRAGEAAAWLSEVGALALNREEVSDVARLLKEIARERRLRPYQFDRDVTAGRYGERIRDDYQEGIYYPENRLPWEKERNR